MTSLISPIVYNGQLVGTVGCDIDLTEMKERVDKLQLFSNSYSFLLSNSGIYVSHPDTSVIGKTMAEINAKEDKAQHISEKIAKGEAFTISATHSDTGKEVVAYFNPITMEGSDSPWCLGVMVIIDDVLDESRSRGIALFIVGIVGLILITLVIGIVSTQISTRVIKGVNFASQISNGDLNATMDDNSGDEIGQLSKSLSSMANRLRDTFKSIGNVSDEIIDSGQTMNTSTEALNTTVEELSNTSTDVSDAVRKVTQSIEQSNSNVQKAREISLTAVYTIQKGTEISQQALDAMTKVTNKIQVINDIAFQTNILALNAAVEAARAGEHGRGFAVVAGEVRKLAERSKQAASEIVDLSRTSLSTVDEVRTVMELLVSEINKTADITVEIARNFEQQLEQTHTINESMSKLNDVSNMTGDAARDLASYSERLLQLAGNLKETAKHFHY
ncbi:MAG TPA: methyl-accepting chemotaxis protein [Tenuifilaceae bacterium]|nr:methyl-accepting chemotaxis protein [Tenuifilaceae bacterium]